MVKDMSQYVLSLLENYPQMIRKIELMRYELRFASAVTPQEMIEVMTYAKKEIQGGAEMPHDVPGIALSYRDLAARLNQETANEALDAYLVLLREQDRLHHYVNLLSTRECEVITKYYFNQRSWNEISKALGISSRTAYAIRSQAIAELATMYSYANKIFAVE
ncbi:MAG: sigma-70 family RNA polymerase sigma factor [Oscillospiraceae bacterium]|nr:sigma-70 family RNA polymerase sigma factor [Oscillospiraceae bacterium]